MFRTSLFGVLGCEMRLAVASQPMRHSEAASGRSYLTCTPHRLEKSRLRSRRGLWKNCWVAGSQNTSRKVTSCVMRNRSCSTIASNDRSPVHSFRTPSLASRSEEHTSELQSPCNLVCRLLLEKKKK